MVYTFVWPRLASGVEGLGRGQKVREQYCKIKAEVQ